MPDNYRLDHLIVLVGGNPLPVTLAADTLASEKGKISIVHTLQTAEQAKRIKIFLLSKKRVDEIQLYETENSDPAQIRHVIASLCGSSAQRVGLDITGGNKIMAVNAFRAFHQHFQSSEQESWLSYVSATEQAIVAEPITSRLPLGAFKIPLLDNFKISIEELLALHSFSISQKPVLTPLLPRTAAALSIFCSTQEGAGEWKNWLHSELKPLVKNSRDKYLSEAQIRSLKVRLAGYPNLRPVFTSLLNELSAAGSASSMGLVHKTFGNNAIEFCRWLEGVWMEHAVLSSLQSVKAVGFSALGLGLKTANPEFELDVVALKGHRLYLFSCTTDHSRYVKQKLFEVHTRAKQLGGDDARVCLVCLSREPDIVREELRQRLPGSSIHVLGMRDLRNLSANLASWISSTL